MKTIEQDEILVSRWGEEVENLDFYQVIKRTPKTVTLQQVRKTHVVTSWYPPNLVMPDNRHPVGKPFTRKVRPVTWDTASWGKEFVRINRLASAYIWNGRAQRDTPQE